METIEKYIAFKKDLKEVFGKDCFTEDELDEAFYQKLMYGCYEFFVDENGNFSKNLLYSDQIREWLTRNDASIERPVKERPKEFACRKCSSLQPKEEVVFTAQKYIFDEPCEIHYNGTVREVDLERKIVWIDYLYDFYKSAIDPIPFDRMVAVSNKNGKYLKLKDIAGFSDLLLPE